jgi:hypothetical protein
VGELSLDHLNNMFILALDGPIENVTIETPNPLVEEKINNNWSTKNIICVFLLGLLET